MWYGEMMSTQLKLYAYTYIYMDCMTAEHCANEDNVRQKRAACSAASNTATEAGKTERRGAESECFFIRIDSMSWSKLRWKANKIRTKSLPRCQYSNPFFRSLRMANIAVDQLTNSTLLLYNSIPIYRDNCMKMRWKKYVLPWKQLPIFIAHNAIFKLNIYNNEHDYVRCLFLYHSQINRIPGWCIAHREQHRWVQMPGDSDIIRH